MVAAVGDHDHGARKFAYRMAANGRSHEDE